MRRSVFKDITRYNDRFNAERLISFTFFLFHFKKNMCPFFWSRPVNDNNIRTDQTREGKTRQDSRQKTNDTKHWTIGGHQVRLHSWKYVRAGSQEEFKRGSANLQFIHINDYISKWVSRLVMWSGKFIVNNSLSMQLIWYQHECQY